MLLTQKGKSNSIKNHGYMETNNIKVSVIIPTFKRAIQLSKAIESVINQTYKNIEVLVVDDNDPETEYRKDTEKLMANYANDYRIVYLKHDKNKNGSAARNTGIYHSTGEIICFLDDDDWFEKNKIEIQLEFLLNNKEFQGVYCGSFYKGKTRLSSLCGDLTKEILLMKTTFNTSTLMFYKSAVLNLNGFDESFCRHQDYEFLLRFFQKYQIASINTILLNRGNNDGENIPKGLPFEKLKNDYLTKFSFIIDELLESDKNIKRDVYFMHNFELFVCHFRNKYYSLALKIFLKHLIMHPFLILRKILIRLLKQDFLSLFRYHNINTNQNNARIKLIPGSKIMHEA